MKTIVTKLILFVLAGGLIAFIAYPPSKQIKKPSSSSGIESPAEINQGTLGKDKSGNWKTNPYNKETQPNLFEQWSKAQHRKIIAAGVKALPSDFTFQAEDLPSGEPTKPKQKD